MIKRLLMILAAAVAMTTVGVVHADAASAATCATHQVVIVQWSVGQDSVSGLNDFQCGGAENLDYKVVYWLEVFNGASWVEANCNGGLCESSKPSSGWYTQGTEHTWTWAFNFAGQIDCRTFRPRAYATFVGGSKSQTWAGPQRQTC